MAELWLTSLTDGSVPPARLLGVALAVVMASVLMMSALSRTLLRPKNSPPVISCMPILGGFAKFIKVCAAFSCHQRLTRLVLPRVCSLGCAGAGRGLSA